MYAGTVKKRPSDVLLSFIAERFDKRNKITWGIILLLFLISYMVLALVPFPDYQQVRQLELDDDFFEMFEPPPQPILQPKESEVQTDTRSEAQGLSEEEIAAAFTFKEVETMDAGGQIIQEMEIFDEVGGGGLDEMMEDFEDPMEGTVAIGDGDFLSGDDADAFFAEGLRGLKTDGETIGIEGGTGTGISSRGSGGGRGGGRGGGIGTGIGPGKAVGTGSGVSVALKSYGSEDYQGKDLIYPLIQWMKSHLKEHPYTMKQFLEYEPEDLTSIVEFNIQDRSFSMFLRCTEETRELALCIVEGTSATKLVDQGISERSHNLEVGIITRNEESGDIIGAYSKRTSPTHEKTDEFMNIFLSWWNDGNPIE